MIGKQPAARPLPIDAILPELLETLQAHNTAILHAPPGAGKTTRVPVALLEILPPKGGRIVMLEPRRIAAVSAARWMAACLDEEVGRTVGYSIRFDSKVSSATRIEVVTEGVLTRRIQNDPGLEGIALVIFDEFHERSINVDLGLLLCREVQQLRPELKLLVMSATLDLQPLVKLLADAPLLSSAGRSFPVEIRYADDVTKGRLSDRVAGAVRTALHDTEGDILAFLPGSGEIRACATALAGIESAVIFQLYGDMPVSEQQRVVQPGVRRRVILATNIAETSVTIDGVTVIIDSGVSRRLQYDSGTGLNRLITVRESKSSAEQRAGRGGRTAPGICYRLYSRHTFNAMTAHTPPEIAVTELSRLLLELAAWGVSDPGTMSWLDAPSDAAVATGRSLLIDLGLLDERGTLTPYGREAVHLPLHPRLSRLLLRSRELDCPVLGCQIAAILAEKDFVRAEYGAGRNRVAGSSDIVERLEILSAWRSAASGRYTVDTQALQNVLRVSDNLIRLLKVPGDRTWLPDETLTARLLLAAYPDRLARRREGDSASYLLVNGRGAYLSERSVVTAAEYLVAVSLDGGSQSEARIHLAAEISEAVIREECRERICCTEEVMWDSREGRVIARRGDYIGSVQLSFALIKPTAELAVPEVVGAIRTSALALLTMNEAVRQLQGRIRLVGRCFPDHQWPDYSDVALTETVEEWLAPHLDGIYTVRRIAALNIAEILWQQLDYRQQRELDRLTPVQVAVPSGSRIRVDYSEETPVLAVKLQELFGQADGPTVCEGRAPLLLHLLSPAGRPIQVTSDLRGFWDGTYVQVKKELKGRYPKHPWPDDPWNAVPTRKLKPRQ